MTNGGIIHFPTDPAGLQTLKAQAAECYRRTPAPPPTAPQTPLPYIGMAEACQLCGLRPKTLRNLLHARDAGLLAAKLPGKAHRFHRERFAKWIETRKDYSRLPGVKSRRKP